MGPLVLLASRFQRPLFWAKAFLRRSRRLLPLVVVLSLVLQLVPLGLLAPSSVANRLLETSAALGHRLSVLPAWVNPDSAAITGALAPVNGLVATFGPPQIAYAQAPTTTLDFAQVCEPTVVNQGELITYSLHITNSTLYTATILITDTFPTGSSYVGTAESTSGAANWGISDFDDYVLIYTNDYYGIPGNGLPPGGVAIRRFQVRVSKPFTDRAVITNTAVLTANIDSEVTRWCTTTVSAPNFVIAKVPNSRVVDAGGFLTYTLFVTNTGHLTATSTFTVADHIPDGTHYITSSLPSTYSLASRTITWTLDDDVGINRAVTTTFVVTVTTLYTNGAAITNTTYQAESPDAILPAVGDPVTVTVRSSPALTLTKAADPDPVQAGALLTYTLTLTNQSSANGHAQNVVVTDTVPVSTWLQSYSAAVAGSDIISSGIAPGSVITWNLLAAYSLPVGESTQITFTVRVHSPEVSGTLITNASYGVTATNATAPTAGDPVTTMVNSSPSLTVTKSVEPSSVLAGNPVTYTITITNEDNETATGVTITDTLPVSFTFGSMAQGPAPSGFPTTVITWTNQAITGTVVPDGWTTPGPLTLVFTATPDENIPDGEPPFTNQVTVTYGVTDVPTGPTAPVTVSKSQLIVAKVGHSDVVSAGGALTYTITYSNATPATCVIITDLLPAHVNFITTTGDFSSYEPTTPLAGRVMTYTIGNLSQSDGSIALVVTVTSPLTNGTVLTNEARISAAEPSAGSTGPVTTTVQSAPCMVLEKRASDDPVSPGDTLTYTLVATNTGNVNATGVVITDVIPTNTTFFTATGTFTPASPSAGDAITWTVGAMDPGDTVSRTLVVTVNSPLPNNTMLTNTAWVNSDEGESDTATETTTVSSSPSLTLTKFADLDTVNAGDTLAYTIVVTNLASANAVATGVVITDVVPDNTEFVTTTISGLMFEGPDANDVMTWTLGSSIVPGGNAVVTFTVNVTSPLADGTILTNIASVICTQGATATGSETTTVHAPDLEVTKSAFPTTFVRPEEIITYVVVFTNSGSIAASDVRVTDTLPVSASLMTSETVGASFVAGSTYAWLSYTVGVDSAGVITITAQVTTTAGWINPAGGTTIANSVEVTATGDGNAANNQANTTTPVRAGLPNTLTLTVAPPTMTVDNQATITATVTDRWGNLVTNADNVTVTLEPGNLITPETITMTLGQATATITSTATGVVFITSTVGAYPTVTDTAQVTFTAGDLHHFVFGPIGDHVAGISFTVSITAYDQYSNVLDYFNGSVTLSDTTGSLTPVDSDNFANGVLMTQWIAITTARANQPIRAISGTVDIYPSNPFTVSAGTPTTITLMAGPNTVEVGVNATLTATLVDTYNSPVPAQVITFETVSLAGLNVVPITSTTGDLGQATSYISSTGIGSWPVTATLSSDPNISAATWVTFTAGPLDHFAIGPVADPQTAGVAFTLVITAQDRLNNTVIDFTGQVTITDSSGTISPTVSSSFVGGARSESVIITCAQTNVTVVVTNTAGTETGASNTFDVIPNVPATVTLLADPVNTPLQSTASLTATVTDAWINPVADSTVVTFTAAHGTVNPITTATLSGQATSQLTADCVERTGVVVTATAGSAFTTTTVSFTAPGAPTSLDVVAAPASIPAGTGAAVVTATVYDCRPGPVPNQVVDFAASLGRLPGSGTTDASGVVTVTLTAGAVVGTAYITATTDDLSDATAVVIEPGSPATVTVTAYPASIPANGTATSTISADVTDVYGNAVADGTGVTLDYSPTTLGSLAPLNFTTTNGSGSAVFTAGTVIGTVTITATAGSAVGTTLLTLTESIQYVYLPLVARNYTPPPHYALVVESVIWIPSPPTEGQPYQVQVAIRNDGIMTVTSDFWVDFCLRPSATPGINQAWNMLSLVGYGKAWLVHDDIGPGQTVTLLTSDADDPEHPADRYSYWPPPLFANSHNPFYVLVDSWGQSYGQVGEGAAEDNNLWGPANASGLGGLEAEEMRRSPGPAAPPTATPTPGDGLSAGYPPSLHGTVINWGFRGDETVVNLGVYEGDEPLPLPTP